MFKGLADIPRFITQVALEMMLLLTITTLASFLQSNLPLVKCLRRKVVLIIITLVLYLSLDWLNLLNVIAGIYVSGVVFEVSRCLALPLHEFRICDFSGGRLSTSHRNEKEATSGRRQKKEITTIKDVGQTIDFGVKLYFLACIYFLLLLSS